jgi:hypothetical protein
MFKLTKSGCSAVGSALDWGSRGRWFKSSHSDQINADRKSGLHLFLCTYHLNRRPHRRVSAVKSAAARADEVGCRWFKSSHSDQINADRKSGLHLFLCTYHLNRRPHRRVSAVKSAAAAADEVGCRWFKSSHSDQINADRKSGLHLFLCTYHLNRRPHRRVSAVKSAAARADVGAIHESPNILCPLSRYSLQ